MKPARTPLNDQTGATCDCPVLPHAQTGYLSECDAVIHAELDDAHCKKMCSGAL